MADFEGSMNLNVETSEIEIKGKFKLSEAELNKVSGGDDGEEEWVSYICKECHYLYMGEPWEEETGLCDTCRNIHPYADARVDVDEALADVDAFMADVDGFDF